MGSEGYRKLTPAIFETAMKYRYAKDNKTAQVYDVIRANIFYDHGRIYSGVLKNLFTATYNNAFKDYDSAWISRSDAVKGELQTLIDSINKTFSDY